MHGTLRKKWIPFFWEEGGQKIKAEDQKDGNQNCIRNPETFM